MSPRKKPTTPKTVVPEPVPKDRPGISNRQKWYIAMLVFGVVVLGLSTYFALSGSMPGFEQRIFNAINGVSLPSWVADHAAKPLSNSVWGMAGLVVVLLAVPKFRMRAWQYVVAAGSAYVLAFIIEHAVGRGRPADLTHQVVLRAMQGGPGFPSGHVAVITALGLTIWPYVGWPWRVLIVVFIGAEAWARVFLGVHAPLDVVGGFAVGMTVVAIIHLTPQKIRKFFRISA